jgi:hypothetical protein
MKTVVAKCKTCGGTKPLICDIRDEWGLAGKRRPKPLPSICLDCWRRDGWTKLKQRRRGELSALVVLVLLLTGMVWLFSELYWKSHGLDQKTYRLFLYLPTVIAAGIFPWRILEMRLMPRYGPFMELLPTLRRFAAGAAPVVLFLLTTFAGFLAALYVVEGRAGFMHAVFGE